jgi:hypothetical protein
MTTQQGNSGMSLVEPGDGNVCWPTSMQERLRETQGDYLAKHLPQSLIRLLASASRR